MNYIRMIILLLLTFSGIATASNGSDVVNAIQNTTRSTLPVDKYKTRDFEEGLVSKTQLEACELIANIILRPIVCISGFVMNVIGYCVLLHKSLRHSSYRYLLGLLLADCGYLLCGIISIPINVTKLTDEVYSSYLRSLIAPFTSLYAEEVFSKISAYIISVLALDRLIAISCPLKVKDMFLSRHSGKVSIWLFIIISVLYVPMIFERHFLLEFNPQINQSMCMLDKIFYSEPLESIMVYQRIVIQNVIMTYIPAILLLLLNIAILVQLVVIRKRRKSLFGKNSQEQGKVTLTLIVISASFLTVFIPTTAAHILHNQEPQSFSLRRREHNFMVMMRTCTSLGWAMNSANDFIIYVITNVKFRCAFKQMFCCHCNKKP